MIAAAALDASWAPCLRGTAPSITHRRIPGPWTASALPGPLRCPLRGRGTFRALVGEASSRAAAAMRRSKSPAPRWFASRRMRVLRAARLVSTDHLLCVLRLSQQPHLAPPSRAQQRALSPEPVAVEEPAHAGNAVTGSCCPTAEPRQRRLLGESRAQRRSGGAGCSWRRLSAVCEPGADCSRLARYRASSHRLR